jgi:hypothetical protein
MHHPVEITYTITSSLAKEKNCPLIFTIYLDKYKIDSILIRR